MHIKITVLLALALTTASVFADEQTSVEVLLAAQQCAAEKAVITQVCVSVAEVQQVDPVKSSEQAAWFEALVKACGKTGSLDAYAVPAEVTATVMQVLADVLAAHDKRMQLDPAYSHDCWS